jgi:organic hydroperoxide reductase OsmC/OhrA
MSNYGATVAWSRNGAVFVDGRYSRSHVWQFDGGLEVPASSSPRVVPLPYSDPAAVDPEEAFVASLSSCHMLWFLSIAAAKGFVVDTYKDEAVGIMEKDAEGKLAITRVTLRPIAKFNGTSIPTEAELGDLHHEAHEKCFLANSVKTEIRCEPGVD